MGFFEKLKNGLKKTKDSMMGRIESLLHSFNKIDEDLFEELEETLILCDIGVTTSEKICDKLRQKVKQEGVKEPEKIKDMLKEIITEMLGEDQKLDMSTTPSVILVIGVNGVGKTTTIGKLAYQLHKQGKKVIVAAADTFRAAAIDQLEVWTECRYYSAVATKVQTLLPWYLTHWWRLRQDRLTLLYAIPQDVFTIRKTLWTS